MSLNHEERRKAARAAERKAAAKISSLPVETVVVPAVLETSSLAAVPPENTPKTEHHTWERFIALGIPGLLVGVAVALIGFTSFWGGVSVGYGALAYFFIEGVFGKPKVSLLWRVVMVATSLILAVALFVYSTWPHPLDISAVSEGDGYSGTAWGIQWTEPFKKIVLKISNDTDSDYGEGDLTVTLPGLTIWRAVQSNVSFHTPAIVPLPDNFPVKPLSFETVDGKQVPIDIDASKTPAARYRVQWGGLSKHEPIELILAVVLPNKPINGIFPGNAFARIKTLPQLHYSGSYHYGNKEIAVDHKLDITQH